MVKRLWGFEHCTQPLKRCVRLLQRFACFVLLIGTKPGDIWSVYSKTTLSTKFSNTAAAGTDHGGLMTERTATATVQTKSTTTQSSAQDSHQKRAHILTGEKFQQPCMA
jgi:hypothetical protein